MNKHYTLGTKSVLIVFFLFFTMTLAQAQSEVDLKGYVVTNAGDTLYGEVHDLQLGGLGGVIRVDHANYESTTLKFKDFKAYKRGSAIFVKRTHTSFKTKNGSFMQVIITGDVVLYRLDYRSDELGTGDVNLVLHDYYIEKYRGALAKVDRADFQNSIMPIISDKPEIKEKVENQEWVFDDLTLIVTAYNRG